MATGFYYLAAAPPASAAVDVCGPGNYSSACVPDNSLSPQSPTPVPEPVPTSPTPVPEPVPTSPTSARDAVPEAPAVESPAPIIEPVVPQVPVVQSPTPLIVEPVVAEPPVVQSPPPTVTEIPILPTPDIQVIPPVSPSPAPSLIPVPAPILPNYINPPVIRTTTIPEPGTVVALLLTGAGIICSARKRNKQVGQQR
ncbi:MAG: PEP-CTERM sorting domain-containing protein [Microcoleus sp. PH2017_10_PVI_O_A]|nr:MULTISPECIES: PEP-CTERM sorting domain-containing protein [unclassified Microcoleus]MCC3463024.1 PEP-CTERM sorting domain-containing protein [Microcoleus sp. PH2017_11_PCY_U_A]MCC3561729.1 PEP-CTERM sorting domain-containing protein [Microcoleus sp. PH2017_27_LUM_O_A]TAE74988.1 MAG: PEP-CTERM sorting domain-containing protein [Oscillatoriales cyanobacterium]MCC3408889.1 PEP-CTERM sorting domain-containing protein [Microcoleus sp. PH2017_10_PVI_O_A]MCC3482173.1 PEP-CTERM sorting domain-conta